MKRILLYLAFSGYLLLVGYLVFFLPSRMAGRVTATPKLVPFLHTIRAIKGYRPNDFWTLLAIDFIGNIVLFIPLGLGLKLLRLQCGVGSVLLTALFISLTIEITQHITKLGVFDTNDVVLNTFGAFIGRGMASWHVFASLQKKG